MKDNKGFSLVEILGVIVILSLLAVASFTILDGVSKRNTEQVYKAQINEILDGAISYANSTTGLALPDKEEVSDCNTAKVQSGNYSGVKSNFCKLTLDLQTLFDEGIIDENIKNPKNKKAILGSSTIEITYIKYNGSNIETSSNEKMNGSYKYTFIEKNE